MDMEPGSPQIEQLQTTEVSKQYRLLTEIIKTSLKSNESSAFVDARVNFDMVEDEDGMQRIVRINEGFHDRGTWKRNIDESTAQSIRGTFQNSEVRRRVGLPVIGLLEPGTMYITNLEAADIRDLPHLIQKNIEEVLKDKTIIEIEYQQKSVDKSERNASKFIHLVLPNEIARALAKLAPESNDPNLVHTMLLDIFTQEGTRRFFDVSLVNNEKDVLLRPETLVFDSLVQDGENLPRTKNTSKRPGNIYISNGKGKWFNPATSSEIAQAKLKAEKQSDEASEAENRDHFEEKAA